MTLDCIVTSRRVLTYPMFCLLAPTETLTQESIYLLSVCTTLYSLLREMASLKTKIPSSFIKNNAAHTHILRLYFFSTICCSNSKYAVFNYILHMSLHALVALNCVRLLTYA